MSKNREKNYPKIHQSDPKMVKLTSKIFFFKFSDNQKKNQKWKTQNVQIDHQNEILRKNVSFKNVQ